MRVILPVFSPPLSEDAIPGTTTGFETHVIPDWLGERYKALAEFFQAWEESPAARNLLTHRQRDAYVRCMELDLSHEADKFAARVVGLGEVD